MIRPWIYKSMRRSSAEAQSYSDVPSDLSHRVSGQYGPNVGGGG